MEMPQFADLHVGGGRPEWVFHMKINLSSYTRIGTIARADSADL